MDAPQLATGVLFWLGAGIVLFRVLTALPIWAFIATAIVMVVGLFGAYRIIATTLGRMRESLHRERAVIALPVIRSSAPHLKNLLDIWPDRRDRKSIAVWAREFASELASDAVITGLRIYMYSQTTGAEIRVQTHYSSKLRDEFYEAYMPSMGITRRENRIEHQIRLETAEYNMFWYDKPYLDDVIKTVLESAAADMEKASNVDVQVSPDGPADQLRVTITCHQPGRIWTRHFILMDGVLLDRDKDRELPVKA